MKNFVRIAVYSTLCLKLYIFINAHHISVRDALFYHFSDEAWWPAQLVETQGWLPNQVLSTLLLLVLYCIPWS